jgi:acetoin utilization protein AcuB
MINPGAFMIAQALISTAIIPLKLTDSMGFALNMMDELKVFHLPVVDQTTYLGLLSEADILLNPESEGAIITLEPFTDRSHIKVTQHPYDAITLFSSNQLSILPVLDENNHYMGCVTLTSLIKYLPEIFSVHNPGGIIILEVNNKDYLLTEIAQIVESNDAKVLSLYIHSDPDSTKLEITLKLNRVDIESVLQTFSRYNYTVKASFSEDANNDSLRERFDSFLKYLSV